MMEKQRENHVAKTMESLPLSLLIIVCMQKYALRTGLKFFLFFVIVLATTKIDARRQLLILWS